MRETIRLYSEHSFAAVQCISINKCLDNLFVFSGSIHTITKCNILRQAGLANSLNTDLPLLAPVFRTKMCGFSPHKPPTHPRVFLHKYFFCPSSCTVHTYNAIHWHIFTNQQIQLTFIQNTILTRYYETLALIFAHMALQSLDTANYSTKKLTIIQNL
jgi:hypothetical protein